AEKGAFTGAMARRVGRFEHADQGSLFLDEIGELPLPLQAKLLRVLQERSFERLGSSKPVKVNVRVIAATNRNLQDEVKKGNFRDDLYWRLNVFPIVLPSLRERKTDIPLLVQYYLKKFNNHHNKTVIFTDEAYALFQGYDWPGNVRELANTVERVVIMAEKSGIGPEDLPLELAAETKEVVLIPMPSIQGEGNSLSSEVERLERQRIILALKENDYIQHRTAMSLGITPRQLGYRIKKYGIQLKR
ncbi:MAG TPA: sigma-54 dependent transcriptional regulator, partial [Thermodesulfovibrionia bacterium]|nr:sigma-54 dependent transcriptional regulator [Thermodesulfovibrionia bacterium]